MDTCVVKKAVPEERDLGVGWWQCRCCERMSDARWDVSRMS